MRACCHIPFILVNWQVLDDYSFAQALRDHELLLVEFYGKIACLFPDIDSCYVIIFVFHSCVVCTSPSNVCPHSTVVWSLQKTCKYIYY